MGLGMSSLQAGWPAAAALALLPATCRAQVAPAVAQRSPDDSPSVRVGGTLFLDCTPTQSPQVADGDGNRVPETGTTALLLDVERVTYTDFAPARPTEKRVAVRMLVSF